MNLRRTLGNFLVVAGVIPAAHAVAAEPARQPAAPSERAPEPARMTVDAACPWGRLSDGRGQFVRCLLDEEAARLLQASAPTRPSATPAALPPPTALPVPAALPPPPVEAPERAAPPPAAPSPVQVEIGAAVADTGALPDAPKSLKKAVDRLAECVEQSGGLSADRGEIELRFLVRGRGRAEGVSVKKFRGVSEAAAKCVAAVIDRRYVGYPEEPIVGATLGIAFTKKKR